MAVCYAEDEVSTGYYKVTFIVNRSGVKLTRGFSSPVAARRFKLRIEHSKQCTLVSCRNFF